MTTLQTINRQIMKLNTLDLWFSLPGKNGEKGPYRYDGKNLYQLQFPKHFLADEYYERFPNNPWSPDEIYYIYKDKKGELWLGTHEAGAYKFNGKTFEKFK